MAMRYNHPTTWPTPPAEWTPPAGWQPDPAWGPAPYGWQFWTDEGTSVVVVPSTPEPAKTKQSRGLHAHFEGVFVTGDTIKHKRESGPLAGATARVESAGAIRQRATVTRAVFTGGLGALMFKKKVDERELFLTIEGQGFAWVIEVDPKRGLKAREFAAKINGAAQSAVT
jgi:hypothetical protein